MIKYKAGLHKDVAKIFDSVWTPQTDNIQTNVSTSYNNSGAYLHARPLDLESWLEKTQSKKKRKTVKKTNQSWTGSFSFLSPKARREKKRLSAISKHLLINNDKK